MRMIALALFAAATVVLLGADTVNAGILGFGDLSQFTINKADNVNSTVSLVATGTVQLTSQAYENRSIFYSFAQPVARFSASYTYHYAGSPDAAFVISADPYQTAYTSSPPLWAAFDVAAVGLNAAVGATGTTMYLATGTKNNGAVTQVPLSPTGGAVFVTLAYDGTHIKETLTDAATAKTATVQFALNLQQLLGGTTGYVGFAAMNPAQFNAVQKFSDFQFVSSVPEPSTMLLLATGITAISFRLLRRRAG
jgi:hypothetical protein